MRFHSCVARINELSPEEKAAAQQMKALRLQFGLTRTRFAQLIGMVPGNLQQRDSGKISWRKSELQAALLALIPHLKKSLAHAESLASIIFQQEPPAKK